MLQRSLDGPVILGIPALLGELTVPADARCVVLIVHGAAAGQRDPGQRFVADVLQCNRCCTLSLGLQTAEEQAEQQQVPDAATAGLRIAEALAWAAGHPALAGRPVGLLGLPDAVPACIAAADRASGHRIGAMVLLDGDLGRVSDALARIGAPTLLLVGRSDAPTLAHRLAIADVLAPRHRLDVLAQATARAEAGALEAVACASAAWFSQTLLPAPPPGPDGTGRLARPALQALPRARSASMVGGAGA